MPDLAAVIRQEAQDARIDPSALQSFRALRLNQGAADVVSSVLVDAATWRLAMGLPAPGERTREYVLGIDLGQNAAMSAAAAYFRSGELEAVAVFPELPGLGERGLADGMGRLYLDIQARGYLILWHDGAEVLADALMDPPPRAVEALACRSVRGCWPGRGDVAGGGHGRPTSLRLYLFRICFLPKRFGRGKFVLVLGRHSRRAPPLLLWGRAGGGAPYWRPAANQGTLV